MVTLYYFARDVHFTSSGPNFTAAQFRRLNGCHEDRLVVCDLWASDRSNAPHPLIIIPSEDFGPTAAQESLFQRILDTKVEKRAERTPRLPYLLRDGHRTFEYIIGRRGPQLYDGDAWRGVWLLCWNFTQLRPVEHPRGNIRSASYHIPLWKLHKRLDFEQNQPLSQSDGLLL